MTDIPPPRYKIVEHKGRIIVTDTWADGGRPSTPHAATPTFGNRARPVTSAASTHLARFRAKLVQYACVGKQDGAGRPVLRTSVHIDEKGPHSIALSEAGAMRLGNWMIVALTLGAVALILLAVSFITALIIIAGLGLALTSANTTARPALTRWFDSLGDTLPT